MKLKASERIMWLGTLPREFLVGLSGGVLVLFILGHLSGNLLLFAGPEVFNAYAEHLHSLGPLLWVARIGLITAFLTHVSLTIWLSLHNRAARSTRYAVPLKSEETNFAKRTMIYSGLLILAFIVFHIYDFTLSDTTGLRSIVTSSGQSESLGLYGVVWNSFADPLHSLIYIAALCLVGLHLSNAIATVWMTFGVLPTKATVPAERIAQIAGTLVTCAFISIPIYVLAITYLAVRS